MPDPLIGAAGGAAAKLATEITVKGATSVYQWYRSYSFLILGQERSGKTSLFNFLRSRQLAIDGESTRPTIDTNNSGVFSFEWKTGTESYFLELRNVADPSGHIGPHEHAKLFVKKKPHVVIIVLDVTSPQTAQRYAESYGRWFEFFCESIGDQLLNHPYRGRKVRSRLRLIIVLLNKIDILPLENKDAIVNDAAQTIRETMRTRLNNCLGSRVEYFPIIPCSMVQNPREWGTSDQTFEGLKTVVRRIVQGIATPPR